MLCGLTENDIIDRLRGEVQKLGSQKAYAKHHRISEQYLSDVLTRKRAPGRTILEIIGIERVIVYQEKQS